MLAVTVEPVGARPAALVTVHVRGGVPAELRLDGHRVGTARRARVRLRLPASAGLGRHTLSACRAGRCRSTPVVVTDGPVLGGCPVLPPGAAYNRDISHDPVAPDSGALVAAQAAGHPIHLDLGSTQRNYGIPFALVGPGQRRLPLLFGTDGADYSSESDRGPVPVPADAPIEGGGDPTSGDRHVLVLQKGRCVLTELYNAVRVRGAGGRVRAWRVSSAARWDLTREQRRPPRWTSADAAGLPILPGLLRYDEAASGTIRHALRFTLPRARRAYQPPASHCGTTTDASAPPYGSRWRLKASFDESPYHGPALAIVRALKRYGLMFADQGSAMYVTGTSDPRWAPVIEELQNRHPIDGGDFEVVQGGQVTSC